MDKADLIIIGAGAAGMSAALAAHGRGIGSILLIDRAEQLGGILQQCVHNGFGLQSFGEDLTGTEYAVRYIHKIQSAGIHIWTNTFVIGLTADRIVTVVNPCFGVRQIQARSVILATGCRERTRGALLIPGSRPSGVLTAGAAQRYLNLMGYLPGRHIVIMGSGDIGLIMARQLTLEGAEVEEVVEIQPFSSGLPRNIAQCLDDFGIPLRLRSTVATIHGKARVCGVTVTDVDDNRRAIAGSERFVPCDTLILSTGLIPESELASQAGVMLAPETGGAIVDQHFMTSVEGIFACGNALRPHDLVDFVSIEGTTAGENASDYLTGAISPRREPIPIQVKGPIQAVIPQKISLPASANPASVYVQFSFRSSKILHGAKLLVYKKGEELFSSYFPFLSPGEMQRFSFSAKALSPTEPITILMSEQG